MSEALADRIEAAIGRRPCAVAPLSGGCVGEVRRVTLADGSMLVAKTGEGADDALVTEGWMLRYLAERSALPVPAVIHADPRLLLIEHIDAGDAIDAAAERHAAGLIAALHGIESGAFGLERDTVIGGLPQPNAPLERWVDFFRERRLLHMAGAAHAAGRLSTGLRRRVETLSGRLERWIGGEARPALIHGDLWSGNVLVRRGRIAGLIDPAIYYADPEIELAFATLFGTFGRAFFTRYGELRPIRPGFFEERRDLYNLYPLLVHVRLFGGAYEGQVARTLARFGL